MAKSKPNSKISFRALNRTLERASAPVYLVNCEYKIQFANQACADWVGVDLQLLENANCIYSSQKTSDPIEQKCQGLCPPPTLFSNNDSESAPAQELGFVFSKGKDNQSQWKSASMSPIFDDEGKQLGVLVVCDEAPATPPAPDAVNCSVNPEKLHVALQQIRTETDKRYSLESLVGQSSFIARVRKQVATAIESNSDLMITGAPGTGKEHLARTIHSVRSTSDQSEMMTVHCSIADQRLIQQNIKDVIQSHSGSQVGNSQQSGQLNWLMLLDVDQLGEAAQLELLGFLQLPELPVKIIATSSSTLAELTNASQFSHELAHCLSPMTIELIPLAKRPKDIPFLAQALLERDNDRREKQLAGFTKSAMAQLSEFHWPENVDQLDRVIQAAAQNANANEIDKSDLPDEFANWLSALRIGKSTEDKIELAAYLEAIEKQLIDRALKQAKGNKTKAAKLLNISRPKLIRRVQHFDLEATTPDFSEIKGDELDESAFEELQ